jgi:large subunit ribosomal protein L25
VDGRVEVVLPRDVELHPFRPKIICVNWLRYRPGRHPGVKLSLPLRAVNEERCPGLKEGGWLLELMHKVPVWAHGPAIPPVLVMDLRGKRVGDKIMATELDLAPGIVLRSAQHDFAVARILGSKRSAAELAADDEAKAGDKGKDDKKAGGAAAKAKS